MRKCAILIIMLCCLPTLVYGWEPSVKDLDSAIQSGDFGGYLDNASRWLGQKLGADVSEAGVKGLLKDGVFANTLDQRQLIFKASAERLGAIAKTDASHAEFLSWLMKNTPAMDLYLEGVVPLGIAAREQDRFKLSVESLEIWKRIFEADPESKDGLYLKLAIATAIAPPGSGNHGAGQVTPPGDPVERYKHFKTAHKNKELSSGFDGLTVWEYQQVVSSCASDADLAWVREMINTWRPDLRIKEQVVNSTSEVWRRDSPHPYSDYKSVISGGGKCGPRSSWSVMVCQAFGIPAIGVGQPAHACVAYKAIDPSVEPQPGNVWKVAYGRGWQVSKLMGMSGLEFLAGIEERSHPAEFSQVEHLRWLASAIGSGEQATALMNVAHAIEKSTTAAAKDVTVSEKAEEADMEVSPAKVTTAPAVAVKAAIKVPPDGARIEAAGFARISGIRVYDSPTGGKQANFQKNLASSWIEYSLDVPESGTYSLVLRLATPNDEQVLEVSSGQDESVQIKVPNSAGLWATAATELRLEKGSQTLKIAAPFQRGIAVRWLELKPVRENNVQK